ncbi:glycine betaine uptake BCCT transporter [Rubrobacter indicoceani]|uniref:glycine betaine uptake BCCT transporter n=1 Tax=Rubrobacter indicoceani TaxID=2051957 RepID=UPI000E5B2890|nr:BCCT family transporter [Rubrobacter indicoceani]
MEREAQGGVGAVFYVSVAISVVFVLWGVLFTENLSGVTAFILEYVLGNFAWLYLLSTTIFLGFVLFLAFSRFGRIRLGKDDDRPEFGRLSWFAMLFAAGMGIGLVFWGVAEPVSHLGTPPYAMAEAGTAQAAELGMRYSFFHWGLHPWAVYATVALALAYFNFRKGKGGLISSIFYPILGDRVDGPLGKAIDVFAIIATLFGVAVSLGLGALQINGGLSFLFDVPSGALVQIAIIAFITVLFLASAATGVNKGIKYLSNLNMGLAGLLLAFVFLLGPTVFLLDTFTQMIGDYAGALIPMSFDRNAFADSSWAGDWTIFYWATWIAWAPFVGAFIARISRGRTIREFVFAVLVVPSFVSFFWFSTMGGTAINLDRAGGGISDAVAQDVNTALFVMLEQLPLSFITSIVAMVLIAVFFITSADSASFVLGSMSSEGSLNPKTPVKFVWGLVIASFASVLLLAGGLTALQNVAIIAAVPFAVIMLGMCVSLYRALSEEPAVSREEARTGLGELKERVAERARGGGGPAVPRPGSSRKD